MEAAQASFGNDLNFEATELRLGLPGREEKSEKHPISISKRNKRPASPSTADESDSGSNSTLSDAGVDGHLQNPPPAKTQVVGWPPVRSYRKNNMVNIKGKKKKESSDHVSEGCGMYVKVSMDGAPYLRKIDLKVYQSYQQLLEALENMFKFKVGIYSEREGYNGSDYVPTYEDKDGDWMLVGDVPWDMFISSCKRLRIMKGSDARGLGRL